MKTSEKRRRPELSLVYVNYRSVRVLRESLGSLRENGGLDSAVEIVVANNDPAESWALRALSREFTIRIVEMGGNRGFGSAANAAAWFVSAPFLGFINPDSRLISGDIHLIPSIFRKHPRIGVLGGRLLDGSGAPELWSAGGAVSLLGIIMNNIGLLSGKRLWKSKRPKQAGYVSGAALFIRRDLFRKLSGFDERFFLYFEDVDLCFRVRQSRWQVWTAPNIIFSHEGGVSHHSKQEQKSRFFESQDRYFRKHRPIWEAVAVRGLRSLFTRYA